MAIKQKTEFESINEAQSYVDNVRQLYRQEEGEYRGRRTPEQQLIAEVTSEEAQLIVDSTLLGILAIGHTSLPDSYETGFTVGGHTWKDFRGEFSRLLVGFGVLTNRLERDGFIENSYANFQESDRIKVASVLFTDFLKHNALRFGVDTAGIHGIETKRFHNDEGGISTVRTVVDKDKAPNQRRIEANMSQRGFSTEPAAHVAGKMSPEEYIALRREFPDMDKDRFDHYVSFYTNARKEFESRE